MKEMHLLDAQKYKERQLNQKTHAIRVLVPKTHYVRPSMELPNVHALRHTLEILTIRVVDLNAYSTRTVQVRWPVSINTVGILVQGYVDQTLNVLLPTISQFVSVVEVLLVILSAVVAVKFNNQCHLRTHVLSVRQTACAELCKVVQHAHALKDTVELHQPVDQNVQAMKNVLMIRAVLT